MNRSILFNGCLMTAFVLGMQAYEHVGRAPAADEVVKKIKSYLPVDPIVLEAGAFDGYDTQRLHRLLPTAQIHSFEPVPEIFAQLSQSIKSLKRVHVYDYALSDSCGQSIMFVSEKQGMPGVPFQASSLLAPDELVAYAPYVNFNSAIQVPTITIDAWAAKYQVPRIDFMWLDMQGYELNALQASPKIMQQVKAILIEVGFVHAYENQYLFDDVKQWLEKQGFTLLVLYDQKWFGDALFVR